MRVPQSAWSTMTAVLVLVLAACGKDGSGPSEFNPDGTTADMSAADEAFGAPVSQSFAAAGTDISVALGGAALASSASLATTARPALVTRYAQKVASLLPSRGGRIDASVASIPSEALGTTFVWDGVDSVYVASDLTGAPANGVRFLLYAVDPVTLKPVLPLNEVGYVDLRDESGASSDAFRVIVVSDEVTYLDYTVEATASGSGGTVTISGFATDGTTRANFNLDNTITGTEDDLVIGLDYDLDVPSRDLSVDYTVTLRTNALDEAVLTLDLAISGANGNVGMTGTYGVNTGNLTVKINGDLFATVSLDGGTTVITGADGDPLTPAEEEALQTIVGWYNQSLAVFDALLTPVY
jgi:hypothetical protein